MFTLQYIQFIIFKFNRINSSIQLKRERERKRRREISYTGNIKTISQALLFLSCFNLHSHLLNPGKSEFCLVEI